MKSPAADLLDTAALLGDVGGRVASVHGDGGARVSVEIGEGAREGGSGGGNGRGVFPGCLQTRVEGAGGHVESAASSTCSASSVAFHRAAWRRGARKTTRWEAGLGQLGRRLGAR